MKKQILLLALMIFSGVLFTSVKNSGVKACGTKATSGASMNKCRELKMPNSDVDDMDASYNIFMNPFTQL